VSSDNGNGFSCDFNFEFHEWKKVNEMFGAAPLPLHQAVE
jgi:hypothetical protein